MDQEIANFIVQLAQSNPKVALILSIIAGARLFLKPMITAFHSTIDSMANNADIVAKFPIVKKIDDWMDKTEKGKIVKTIAWVFDYLFSIKVLK